MSVCARQCVGQSRQFHSTVVSGKKELYWAACWSVVPFHCGEWEERVVLGSVLVRGSIPLWCMGRRCYTWQCIGQWFHSTVMHGKRAALGSALVSQDGSTPQWFVGSKSCTGQCISQERWFHSTVVHGKKELYWTVCWSVTISRHGLTEQ